MSTNTRPVPVADALPIDSSWWELVDRRAELTPDRIVLGSVTS